MAFHSLEFFFLVAINFCLFYSPLKPYRLLFLLGSSLVFYGYHHLEYLPILLLSIFVDYSCGRSIIQNKKHYPRRARLALATSLCLNLSILFFFKYIHFALENFHALTKYFFVPLDLKLNFRPELPVGISFYTFQSMSYTMDCYLGRFKQSPRFLLFSLYVSFFPQLIAGPIVRSRNFFTQWKKDLKFDYENAVEALYFIAFGLMLKIVLADNLAPYVDRYYNSPGRWNITVFIFATYCFAIQIYADFWGYTLMARGVAKLFAIELPINFQSPYQAHSIRDFWQRWHQSLSSWFRDYLYIPLGGSRLGQLRTQCNILIVFLISGAWHGANWTFILWGAFHGICLLIENQFLKDTRQQSNQFAKPFLLLKRLMTFHLVLIGWSIFRTNTVSDLVIHWEHLLNLSAISLDHLLSTHFISPLMLSFCILVIILALLIDFLNSKNISIRKCAKSIPYFFRWGIYAFILLIILALGEWREKAFIYFQF